MEIGQIVYCVSESVYELHLTKGSRYRVYAIGMQSKGDKVRIRGNIERLVWIPNDCFSTSPPPKILSISIDDEKEGLELSFTDVTVEFDLIDKRWMTFMSLSHLSRLLTDGREYISSNKLILMKELTRSNILRVIEDLDKQDEIVENSTPVIIQQ